MIVFCQDTQKNNDNGDHNFKITIWVLRHNTSTNCYSKVGQSIRPVRFKTEANRKNRKPKCNFFKLDLIIVSNRTKLIESFWFSFGLEKPKYLKPVFVFMSCTTEQQTGSLKFELIK